MEVQDVLQQARDAIRADRTYAPPYEKNGLTIIPASTVRGGGGGGDRGGESGGGFGLIARPSGAWVIEGDHVTWKPVFDPGKAILGAELLVGLALLRRRHRRRVMLMRALGGYTQLRARRHRRRR